MAEVYLAEQVSLERKVALKILNADLAKEKSDIERFLREARAAARLIHAHIVQVYEVGQSGSIHYIAQEYVEGENLGQWITRIGPLDAAPLYRSSDKLPQHWLEPVTRGSFTAISSRRICC